MTWKLKTDIVWTKTQKFFCIPPAESSWFSFLIPWRIWDSASLLVCRFISVSAYSLFSWDCWRGYWTYPSQPHRQDQSGKTRPGRCRRQGTPGGSASWWRPRSPGGRLGTPVRGTRSSRQVAEAPSRVPWGGMAVLVWPSLWQALLKRETAVALCRTCGPRHLE